MGCGMDNPVLIEVTRGGTVESIHRGAVAIADASGRIVKSIGDIGRPNYPRSALKMLQAIPLVASGAAAAHAATAEELALACASHCGEAVHVSVAARWLARLSLGESDLACGPHLPFNEASAHALICSGTKPSRLHNNCSGKHTGFLTLAKHLGTSVAGYEQPGSAVQAAVRAAVTRFCGIDADMLPAGTDGCNAPILGVPLAALATAMARFGTGTHLSTSDAEAAATLCAAMRAHPALVDGEGRLVTRLIRALPAGIAKLGAEGNFVAALPELGLGVAVKIDDGAARAAETAIVALLVTLGALGAADPAAKEFLSVPVLNTTGLSVGAVRPAEALRRL